MALRSKIEALTRAPLWQGEIEGLGQITIHTMDWDDQLQMQRFIMPEKAEYTPEELQLAADGAVFMVWASVKRSEPDVTKQDIKDLLVTAPGMALLAKVSEVVKERSSATFLERPDDSRP
jgi:hypothetical protein